MFGFGLLKGWYQPLQPARFMFFFRAWHGSSAFRFGIPVLFLDGHNCIIAFQSLSYAPSLLNGSHITYPVAIRACTRPLLPSWQADLPRPTVHPRPRKIPQCNSNNTLKGKCDAARSF